MRFRLTQEQRRAIIDFDDGAMNLLSSAALSELAAVIQQLTTHTPQLLVFRSGRPGLFAAGADMGEMQSFSPADAAGFSQRGQELFASIERLPFITVAMIDGDCFGGALDLAMAFDIRLATERSRFAHPGARLGIVTGFGGTSRWRKIINRPAAHALFINNESVTAAEAASIGLIDAVGDSHDERLARLETIDSAEVAMVKQLTRSAPALNRVQLRLLSERLAQLYFP